MDKKSSIYEAAVKIFAKRGFEQASVDEIAEVAHVAKGTIYYHFESKDDIFLGLIDRGITDIVEIIRLEISKIDGAKNKLIKIIELQTDFYNKYRDFCKILLSEFWRFDTTWKHNFDLIKKDYVGCISQVVDEGQASGEFKKEIDPEVATTALFSLIAITGFAWAVSDKKISQGVIKKNVVTIFLDGIES